MSKHTPGPWIVDLDRDFILGGGDTVSVEAMAADGIHISREVCTCMLDTDSHPDGDKWMEDSANARLISAAPDLLAALKLLLPFATGKTYSNDINALPTEPWAAREQAEAAIAKAEGRES